MISNSDFEKAWFLYKTEYEPQVTGTYHSIKRRNLTFL